MKNFTFLENCKASISQMEEIYIGITINNIWYMSTMGPNDLGTSAHLISSLRPMLKRKKCPRTNKGNPDRQIVLPRMTLSSTGQNHRREKCHVAQGNLIKDRKRDSKPYGLAIGEWGRDNPRRSRHLRIKYPQLTP